MTVQELYAFLEERILRTLSCDWDNDGLMCCADETRAVKRVLVALDVTADVVKKAADEKFDLIVSHHPLIFRGLKSVTKRDIVAAKVIALLSAGVSVMSFHTRLDAVERGVNDALAAVLELEDIQAFGANGEAMGRIGTLKSPVSLEEFAMRVKKGTGAEQVLISDAGIPVSRVALLGGSGADEAELAHALGADTYLTGELKHHQLTEAPERGMNLIMGGHFHTENPVCERLKELVLEADPTLHVEIVNSNTTRFV